MKSKNYRQKFGFSLFLVFTFLINFVSAARAQDVVTSEDFTGGSSAFIFQTGRKATQGKVAFRASSDIKRNKKLKAETTRRIIRQAVTVAKVNPKRAKSKEVDPTTPQYRALDLNRKPPQEVSVIFSGVGEYYLNLDDTDKALEFFREATSLDAKNVNAKNGLSEALTRQGDKLLSEDKFDLAKLPYEEALKNNPKNGAAHAGLAEIFAAREDSANAIAYYEKALSLDADLTELNAPLGVLYFQKGEIAKAEAALQKAIATNPDNAETQFFLGLVRYKQQRDEEAITALRRAVELDPKNGEAFYYLGEVYDRRENEKDSIAAYRKAVEIEPKYMDAWFDLGAAYYNRASNQGPNSVYYEEAIKAYKEVAKLKPTNGEAYANLGDVYRQLDRLDEAISAYRLATNFITDRPELYANYGFVAAKRAANPAFRSFWKTAFENFEKAITAEKQNSSYINYQNLGWAYYNAARSDLRYDRNEAGYRDKTQKAKEAFQKALALNPPPKVAAAINLNLGMTLTDSGDYKGAAEALKRATDQEKNWLPAINELGIAYRKNGDLENAAKQFRRAVEVDERFVRGYYNLAETEFQRGNVKEAKKLYDKLKSMKQLQLTAELERATNGGILR